MSAWQVCQNLGQLSPCVARRSAEKGADRLFGPVRTDILYLKNVWLAGGGKLASLGRMAMRYLHKDLAAAAALDENIPWNQFSKRYDPVSRLICELHYLTRDSIL